MALAWVRHEAHVCDSTTSQGFEKRSGEKLRTERISSRDGHKRFAKFGSQYEPQDGGVMHKTVVTLLGTLMWGCTSVCGQYAQRNILVVDTDTHRVNQCENGKSVGTHHGAIGYNGTGRSKIGDGRTLTGEFSLGAAKASKFYKRLPFGETVTKRYHGSPKINDCAFRHGKPIGCLLGLHAPPNQRADPLYGIGRFYPYTDATLGCVGLGSKEQVDAIETWRRRSKVRRVIFLADTRTNLQLRHGVFVPTDTHKAPSYALDASLKRRYRLSQVAPMSFWLAGLNFGHTASNIPINDLGLGVGFGVDHGAYGALSWSVLPEAVWGRRGQGSQFGGRLNLSVGFLDDLFTVSAGYGRMWSENRAAEDHLRLTMDLVVGRLLSHLVGI